MGAKTNNFKSGYLEISECANIIFNIILSLLSILCIYPILLVFSVSITDEKIITKQGYSILPKKVSFYAYEYIFKNSSSILRAYGTTIFITVVGSILSLIIIAMYAYPLSRKDFKRRKIFSFIIYFTMLFNGGLVPWYMVYVKLLHLKNNYWALIIPALISPMYVLIMRTFFATSIPDELIDAAKIDGAGEFYTFLKIVIPLAKPALGTIALFSILGYWNDWYLSLLFMTDEKKFTLQYLLYRVEQTIQYLSSSTQRDANAAGALANIPSQSARMAMAIVAIGPIVFAYPFLQKYFVKGLTIGAIKG